MAQILVTGGAGFIGANLVRCLVTRGHRVRVVDNLARGNVKNLPDEIDFFQGDVNDQNVLAKVMDDIESVIHLAALGSVVESVAAPIDNFRENAWGTLMCLEGARRAGIRRFIFASTGGALIGDAPPPVSELSLPKPISPYGASKLCGEAYCHAYAKSLDMGTTVLRFANVYGPYSIHKKGAITKFIKCIIRGEAIPIFGDGSASRDYLHVADLCQGIAQAVESPLPSGDVFHLASGKGTSVKQLAYLLMEIAGINEHPIEYFDKRPGEVDRNFAEFTKARDTFGFSPRKPLEIGLRETWEWFRDNWDHNDNVV